MLKDTTLALAFSCLLLAGSTPQQVAAVLDDWHQAASVADEERYFKHFAPNGVFMGTDATERWTVSQFREWAKPHFQRKKAWSFKPRDRHIDFSADGRITGSPGSMKCWTHPTSAFVADPAC
jgi:hypothetical protein